MGKNHRGKGIVTLPAHGRGECPVCHRTGIKLLYDIKQEEKTIKVCKVCNKISAR
jgi:hypothetical protein